MDPSLALLVTAAGAAPITSALVEVIVRTGGMAEATVDRFGPIISIIVGIGVVLIASVGLGVLSRPDIIQGLFTGLVAGFAAMGIHDVASGTLAGGADPGP